MGVDIDLRPVDCVLLLYIIIGEIFGGNEDVEYECPGAERGHLISIIRF